MLTGGTDAEFSAFAARDGGQLVGFAFLLTGNRHDAEDLAQQALVRTAARWRRGPGCAGPVQPDGRAQPGQGPLAGQAAAGGDPRRGPGRASRRWRMPPRRPVDRQLLLRACRLLPLHQRAVLVLRFWEDRSIEETAAVLGCSAGTVKSQTHRALARLRDALAGQPGDARRRTEDAPCSPMTACSGNSPLPSTAPPIRSPGSPGRRRRCWSSAAAARPSVPAQTRRHRAGTTDRGGHGGGRRSPWRPGAPEPGAMPGVQGDAAAEAARRAVPDASEPGRRQPGRRRRARPVRCWPPRWPRPRPPRSRPAGCRRSTRVADHGQPDVEIRDAATGNLLSTVALPGRSILAS